MGSVNGCPEEVHSWDYFTHEQLDSYYITCTLSIPHDIHEDENTGLTWRTENSMDEKNILANPSNRVGNSFLDKARGYVQDYFNYFAEKTNDFHLELDQVYVVWGCKTLQNWKCIVTTEVDDGMLYEVTYNGDKGETYIDAYKKHNNVCIKDVVEANYDPGLAPKPAVVEVDAELLQ